MTVLLGLLIFLFVGFCVRGGLILRAGGMLLILNAGRMLLFPGHSVDTAIFSLVVGVVFWLLGHFAYDFAYGEYKSAAAGYLIEDVVLPHLHLRRALYAIQRWTSQAGRIFVARLERVAEGTPLEDLPPQAALPPAVAEPASALDEEAIRRGVLEAGDVAAEALRSRLQATLEEVDGPDWLEQVNRHRAKRHAPVLANLDDARAVLSTFAHYPTFEHEPTNREARQLLDMLNGAHHTERMAHYEITRAWNLATKLGARRPSHTSTDIRPDLRASRLLDHMAWVACCRVDLPG